MNLAKTIGMQGRQEFKPARFPVGNRRLFDAKRIGQRSLRAAYLDGLTQRDFWIDAHGSFILTDNANFRQTFTNGNLTIIKP